MNLSAHGKVTYVKCMLCNKTSFKGWCNLTNGVFVIWFSLVTSNLWLAARQPPAPVLHRLCLFVSTTASVNGHFPLRRCARAVLGEFPVHTNPFSPFVDSTLLCLSAAFRLSCSFPPLLHATEHAACSSHLLALQTLEIFSCKPCRFRQTHIAFARRRLSKRAPRIGSGTNRRGKKGILLTNRTQGKGLYL